MYKFSSKEIIDIVSYSQDKIIIAEKKLLGDFSMYKPNCFVLDITNGKKEVITKSAYLMKKFGSSYEKIVKAVNNYAECESMILPERDLLVIFPNGQAGVFDSTGNMQWNDTLKYNDSPVCGLAADGEYFWSCCKNENCVIRFNAKTAKVDLRIGSKNAATFISPSFVSDDEKYVYVCCNGTNVRKIDKSNYVVSDVGSSFSGIQKYYKFGDAEILCTSSGAYLNN